MNTNWVLAIIFGTLFLGIAASETAKNCRGGLSEVEARKVKNTVERLDKDMDDLKARKCECPR